MGYLWDLLLQKLLVLFLILFFLVTLDHFDMVTSGMIGDGSQVLMAFI